MKLQNLLFPEAGICSEVSLYMRKKDTVNFLAHNKILVFQKYADCSFDTYFNSLTIEKWIKYTNITKVSLVLKLKGDFEITLLRKEKINNNVIEQVVDNYSSFSKDIVTIECPFTALELKGLFSFRLKALSDEAEYYGGWYDGIIDKNKYNNVNLAINICTFKREAFIEKNLKLLNEKILNNPTHEMFTHLKVFVSDNGQTLNSYALNTEKIHIVKNKNLGGAGGFTRGLIEIMNHNHNKQYDVTHVVMMDDDVIVEPEAIYRTYTFLCCLKEEYKDIAIAGAMLRLDMQYIQHESGAIWNGDVILYVRRGWDLRLIDKCLRSEVEDYVNYGAWWYYCMPLSVISDQNLPLPIFIKGDDIEYGIRNGKFITLNSICVWHEPFENKYSSFQCYYTRRNQLYCDAMHFPNYTKVRFLKRLYNEVLRELLYYRYKNAELILRAVEDFYKGVEFLEQTDGEELHKNITQSGYKVLPVEQLNMEFNYERYQNSLGEKEPKKRRIWRLLTLNGLLLSANRNKIVSMAKCRPINFYRVKRALQYDVTSKKAFIVERNRKESIRLFIKLLVLTVKTISVYGRKMEEFRQNANRVTNITFWEKYLGIK